MILKKLGHWLLPGTLRRWILRQTRRPPVGKVDYGDLRRLHPISRSWGGDRGLPIDRHYIEAFLDAHADDIRGRVLEVGNNVYTLRFGGDRVKSSEIVNAPPGTPTSDFVADFMDAPQLPSAAFDCVICTQTLQLIPDLQAAVATLHRILKPGGVLLVTQPGISQLYRDQEQRWNDYWRFTHASAGWLFEKAFSPDRTEIAAHGNVLAAVSFLHGVAADEVASDELSFADPLYQVTITIRAVKTRITSDPGAALSAP